MLVCFKVSSLGSAGFLIFFSLPKQRIPVQEEDGSSLITEQRQQTPPPTQQYFSAFITNVQIPAT